MDSPRSDANNQIIISRVSSHEDTPEQGSPLIEQGESSESAIPATAPDQDPPLQLAMVYGCRYCHKKFSNKQALGGHQNAHKVERAMEKNMQETDICYYDGPNPYPARLNVPGTPFLGSYHRHHLDFLHRSLFSRSGGGGVVSFNPRPTADPYAPCPAADPRVPPFPARPHYTLPGQNMNVRLANLGPRSSSAFRPVCNHPGPSGLDGFVIRPGCGSRPLTVAVNLMNVPGNQHGESGLDLSLKLG